MTKVGRRGLLFSFDELNKAPYYCTTNVFILMGHKRYYVCDTYLGAYYMTPILTYLESHYGKKDYVIFNSHSHWDHIWGNSLFHNHLIVSHEKCRAFIQLEGEEEMKAHADSYAKEQVEIVLPNVTFSHNMVFEDDEVEFFYSPGHSEDSSSCYDRQEKILFVGDNVEAPLPSLSWHNMEQYILTLQDYLEMDVKDIVISHGPVINRSLIRDNIAYLFNLKRHNKLTFSEDDIMHKHHDNLKFLNHGD